MKLFRWESLRKLRELLEETTPPPEQMALRLRTVERDIILPVKAVFIGILVYSFYFSRWWFNETESPDFIAQQIVEQLFLVYFIISLAVAGVLIFYQRFSITFTQRVIFNSIVIDTVFLSALMFATGGFSSILYWLFLGLIVRNAVSSPLAAQQIVLNVVVSFCYLAAGLLAVGLLERSLTVGEDWVETPAETFVLRLVLLWLMGACCYGVQVLFEKQRQAEEEAREFASRQEQLRSAGTVAAQIAHRLKNPLGIINNAAYSLQRALKGNREVAEDQLQIIREEVQRADSIITNLMGYAQLAEGKVERLNVQDEILSAIQRVQPDGTEGGVRIETHFPETPCPPLLMQRVHLSEILVNLILNACEAVGEAGKIEIDVSFDAKASVVISVKDNGPGIPAERFVRIFDPYFSTKKQGSGLGLAIVKQNAEIYGGAVHVDSELGKGACFVLELPTRTFMKFRK